MPHPMSKMLKWRRLIPDISSQPPPHERKYSPLQWEYSHSINALQCHFSVSSNLSDRAPRSFPLTSSGGVNIRWRGRIPVPLHLTSPGAAVCFSLVFGSERLHHSRHQFSRRSARCFKVVFIYKIKKRSGTKPQDVLF